MKQISNWVFGSFFRTIGRLLVFVLLGIIIAHFIDFGDLKDSFSITDLFFAKLDALSLDGNYIGEVQVWQSAKNIEIHSYNTTEQAGVLRNSHNAFTQNYYNGNGYEWAVFTLSYTDYENYTTEGDVDGYTYNRIVNMINRISLTTTSGPWGSCELQGNLIVCNMSKNSTYNGLRIDYVDPYNPDAAYFERHFFINHYMQLWTTKDQAIINSINEQTQQQQQQHNETQSYLEDSNTTQAEDDATEFFADFDAPDQGGLSAIITAPLNTIRALLNSTCTNLVLPLPYVNENLTLPCMTSIYTQHFGAFFTIYQTIILAIIAYRCIRSIYFDLHGFTNPNDDRIEVMDL